MTVSLLVRATMIYTLENTCLFMRRVQSIILDDDLNKNV